MQTSHSRNCCWVVFDLFITLSGPQIAIFSRFKDQLLFIDQKNYPGIDKNMTGYSDCYYYTLTNAENHWL